MNEPLTPTDLQELERLLFRSSELGTKEDFERAYGPQDSLGRFIRSLVGLDREAAKRAFGEFLADSRFDANQIRFINQIIDDLTANGTMEPARLYEPPYTDLSTTGLDGVFGDSEADGIIRIITTINENTDVRRRA
jgi:type I restriction enzyme, R subunit